jgi:hypothetical protein
MYMTAGNRIQGDHLAFRRSYGTSSAGSCRDIETRFRQAAHNINVLANECVQMLQEELKLTGTLDLLDQDQVCSRVHHLDDGELAFRQAHLRIRWRPPHACVSDRAKKVLGIFSCSL